MAAWAIVLLILLGLGVVSGLVYLYILRKRK